MAYTFSISGRERVSMATAALTLGIVGLFTWIFPFLGFPVSIIGTALAAIVLLMKRPNRKKAMAGLIMCVIGLIMNIIVVVAGVAALGMLGIIGQLLEEMYGPMY